MTDAKLTLAQLIEGGLALLLSRPWALALFALADAALSYGGTWAAERETLNPFLVIALAIGLGALVSGALMLTLGGRLREVVSDPAELFVRLVFVVAVTLIMLIGSAAAAVLFIVPGLFVAARWSLAAPLVLLDGAGVIGALRTSWELTEGTAWALVGVFVIVTAPSMILGLVNGGELAGWPPSPGVVVEFAVGAVLAAFEAATYVFALRSLAPLPDELTEVFS